MSIQEIKPLDKLRSVLKTSFIKSMTIAMCCLTCIACEPEMDYELTSVKKQLVVDGWIENNNYAQVVLTYNTGYFSNLDSASFRGLVASRAKVILSDGTQSEILTLTKDTNYFPPYVYKGNEILGQPGKTYTLIIIDEINTGTREMDTIVAITTIPQPVKLDSVWFSETSDSSGIIKGIIFDNPDEKNYYRTFSKIKGKDKRFIPTYIASFEDKYFNGQKFTFHLNKGLDSYIKPLYNIEFNKGDTINLKIASIDRISFLFWSSYDQEIFNSGNPFASNFDRVNSNIHGGLGIWCGYGATTYLVVAK